jgi:hypothetical protein
LALGGACTIPCGNCTVGVASPSVYGIDETPSTCDTFFWLGEGARNAPRREDV